VRLINGKTLREFRIEQLRKSAKFYASRRNSDLDALAVLALIRVAECAKALDDFDCPSPEHHSTHVEPIPCGECANCELAAALVDLEAVR
jgi:hypothetical protein